MFWLKVLFIVVVFVCQMYVIRFQSSGEGKDERGKEIQHKTNNTLYNIMYICMILLIVLNLLDIVATKYIPDILLYLILTLSIFGGVFTYINKNQKNY